MRLLIVDDHEVVREGLVAVLAPDERFEVVATAGSGVEALARLDEVRPDVAVIDLRLPDTPGDRLCRTVRERRPETRVVVLSSYMSADTVRAAKDAGASAYVAKSAGLSELRQVLGRMLEGEEDDAPQIVEQLHRLLVRREDEARTTPQQERVLELAAEGLTYHEIGDRLCISESTVRFHMQKLKGKFGARTKTDLIAKAIRNGILAPAVEGDQR